MFKVYKTKILLLKVLLTNVAQKRKSPDRGFPKSRHYLMILYEITNTKLRNLMYFSKLQITKC